MKSSFYNSVQIEEYICSRMTQTQTPITLEDLLSNAHPLQLADVEQEINELYNRSRETSSTGNDEMQHSGQCPADFLLTPDEMRFSADCAQPSDNTPAGQGQSANCLSDDAKNGNQPDDCGLLHYRKWWERVEVVISVQGKLITGTPIFVEGNALRVINDNHSYFIPLEKVDYIRTSDGLRCIPR